MEAKHLALERGGIFELNQSNYLPNESEYQSDNSVNPALLWDMIKMKVRENRLHMQQLKTTNLSPVRISFTKKYQVWRKN